MSDLWKGKWLNLNESGVGSMLLPNHHFLGEGFSVRQFGHYNSIKSAMVPRKFKRQNKWHKTNGSMTHVKELFWETPSFQRKQLSSKIPPFVETKIYAQIKKLLIHPPQKNYKKLISIVHWDEFPP